MGWDYLKWANALEKQGQIAGVDVEQEADVVGLGLAGFNALVAEAAGASGGVGLPVCCTPAASELKRHASTEELC